MVFQCGLAVCTLDLISSRVFGNTQDRVWLDGRGFLIREGFGMGRHAAPRLLCNAGLKLCGVAEWAGLVEEEREDK
jgi:hypothetical protein